VIPYTNDTLPKPKLPKRPSGKDYKRPPRDRFTYVPDHAATL